MSGQQQPCKIVAHGKACQLLHDLQIKSQRPCFLSQHTRPHTERLRGHLPQPRQPVQDTSSNTGRGDDATAVILSLLTSRVEEEHSTLGVLGEAEAESRNLLGGTGGPYSSRLLDTSLARNTSSMGSQSSPMPLLRQAGNAYNSDSRRWRARPVQLSVGDSE